MPMPFAQNFDALTPPALPSGMTFEGSSFASSAAQSVSTPNSLHYTGSALEAAYFSTQDGNSGNVVASVSFRYGGSNLPTFISAFARKQNTVAYTSGSVHYEAKAIPGTGVEINYRSAGGSSPLANLDQSSMFSADTWYKVSFTCNGTSLSVKIQRLSDGLYVQPTTGAWGATAQACLSATDANLTTQGYEGVFIHSGGAAQDVYLDDFSVTAYGAGGSATTYTLSGPTTGTVGQPSANFTVTFDSAYTGTMTLSDGVGDGTYTPSSPVSISAATTKTFTYTPTSINARTITPTFSPPLTASGPATATYTASAGTGSGPTVAQIVAGVWDELRSNTRGAGTYGALFASGKVPATLASADVSGNLPADIQKILGATPSPQAYPANFSALAIDTAGAVTGGGGSAGTPQTGDLYAVVAPLVSGGAFTGPALAHCLDSVSVAESSGPPSTFREWLVWVFRRTATAALSITGGTGTLVVKKANAATWTTQAVTSDGAGHETLGPLS